MFGLKEDWPLDIPDRYFTLEDYMSGAEPRWCPGCGDHGVLTAIQRICKERQIPPEKAVSVSGIGCSSRFPHYMGTYGFHGLHGRALPVACGIKARRPDLTVFVATGDGDCCSIGAGHWIHAVRYNMDLTVMLFDNNVYGLTKNQTSPTTRTGWATNTHPRGSWLPPLNPTQATLGFTNLSFMAQTVDWNPPHVYQTLRLAMEHRGLSFVRIMQRCPQYTGAIYKDFQDDPSRVLVLKHPDGIPVDPALERIYTNQLEHDPSDIHAARELADREDVIPIGLFFRDADRPCYEDFSSTGLNMPDEEKLAGLDRELDKLAI